MKTSKRPATSCTGDTARTHDSDKNTHVPTNRYSLTQAMLVGRRGNVNSLLFFSYPRDMEIFHDGTAVAQVAVAFCRVSLRAPWGEWERCRRG
jgi:hypothetical protein